jgi:hypothetical protein
MHDDRHEHGHDEGARGGADAAKTTALLEYMAEHNARHAEELAALASRLREAGFDEAARAADGAVLDFRSGGAKLEEALVALKGVV